MNIILIGLLVLLAFMTFIMIFNKVEACVSIRKSYMTWVIIDIIIYGLFLYGCFWYNDNVAVSNTKEQVSDKDEKVYNTESQVTDDTEVYLIDASLKEKANDKVIVSYSKPDSAEKFHEEHYISDISVKDMKKNPYKYLEKLAIEYKDKHWKAFKDNPYGDTFEEMFKNAFSGMGGDFNYFYKEDYQNYEDTVANVFLKAIITDTYKDENNIVRDHVFYYGPFAEWYSDEQIVKLSWKYESEYNESDYNNTYSGNSFGTDIMKGKDINIKSYRIDMSID